MVSNNVSLARADVNEINLSDLVTQEIGHNTLNAHSGFPQEENDDLRDTFAKRDMQEAFTSSNMYFTQEKGPNRNSSAKLLTQ